MGLFTSQTSTKPNVPAYLKNYNKLILGDAKNDFKGDDWLHAYTGSLVTPFNPETMSAFGYNADGTKNGGGMLGLADANSNGKGMSSHLQEILNNGGFSNDQMQTMSGMKGLINNRGLNNLIEGDGLTADQRAVADFYRGDMNEAFDPETIPGYAQVRSRTLDAGANAVAGQAAKMGRLGGAANQGILARSQMDTAASLDNAEYDKWRARRTAGAGGLAGVSQQGVDNQSNAISLKSGMQGQLFNAQASGLDRMGQAYQTAQMPYQTQRAVGAEMEDLYSRQLADQKRIHDETDPLKRQLEYMSLATGQPVGQTSTTSPSWAQLISAGGLAAASLPTLFGWR